MNKTTMIKLLLICFLINYGCAGVRDVQNNVFTSTGAPKVSIKVDPDFVYMGKSDSGQTVKGENSSDSAKTGLTQETYVFGDFDMNHYLDRGVAISIEKLGKGLYWLPDMYANVENKLDSGVVKIGDKVYQYIIAPSARVLTNKEESKVNNKGFIIANCYLVKSFARRIGAKRNTRIYIHYMERITNNKNNNYGCTDENNTNIFISDQNDFLKDFDSRVSSAMLFLDDDGSILDQELIK